MDDDFQNEMRALLHTLTDKVDAIADEQKAHRVRLDAIVARIDEQDTVQDRLIEKVDRLSHAVRDGLQASEEALNAVTMLGRRVRKLEFPDD
ncbi:MAG: hypothetical protein AAGF71_14155 [Pseudomonadota bacterium]